MVDRVGGRFHCEGYWPDRADKADYGTVLGRLQGTDEHARRQPIADTEYDPIIIRAAD